MKFGEKVQLLRKEKGLSQQELGAAIGVSGRTVLNWENNNRYPKDREMYDRLAVALGTDKNFLLSESDDKFAAEVVEEYGQRAAEQARQVLEEAKALYAGGALSEEDKVQFLQDIQKLFLESKGEAKKKFTPKKYRKE